MCSRSGLSGDELKVEQGIILTQLAYIKQLRGENKEALQLYSDVQNQEYPRYSIQLIMLGVSMLRQGQSP
jgi:hypothetical protein